MLDILKEEQETKERSTLIESPFDNSYLWEKNILLQLHNKIAKKLIKSHAFSVPRTVMIEIDV